ncbi:MAG: winged helix-turn-helix domain-containing protein [Candidatus Neomarinimicrobiota bacterium]
MPTGPSPQKQRFVNFVRRFAKNNDRNPTFQEIVQGLKSHSPGTINWYVRELEKSGAL